MDVKTDDERLLIEAAQADPARFVELYDRNVDPYQLQNVAADPAYATVKADLAAKLAQLQNCKGKSCNVAP